MPQPNARELLECNFSNHYVLLRAQLEGQGSAQAPAARLCSRDEREKGAGAKLQGLVSREYESFV